jgi:hypothetical protein
MTYIVEDENKKELHEGNKFSCIDFMYRSRMAGRDIKKWRTDVKDSKPKT